MRIRQEREEEFPAIYDLVKVAFQTAKVSSGDEQNFVLRLRAGGNYIPELALVAEEDGKLLGHIMLTKTFFVEQGREHEVLLLAPISVVLESRNQGIGKALVEEVFRLAREKDYTAAVLVGDPAYYERFGFRPTLDFGIKNTNGIPDQYVMACELIPGALQNIGGAISFEV